VNETISLNDLNRAELLQDREVEMRAKGEKVLHFVRRCAWRMWQLRQ